MPERRLVKFERVDAGLHHLAIIVGEDGGFNQALTELREVIPAAATILRPDDRMCGAFVFWTDDRIRVIEQYDIQCDVMRHRVDVTWQGPE